MKEKQNPIVFIQNPETIRLLTKFSTEPHERIVALVYTPGATPLLFVPALEHQVAQKAEPGFIVKSYQDHEVVGNFYPMRLRNISLQSLISPWKKWTSHSLLLSNYKNTSPVFDSQWT